MHQFGGDWTSSKLEALEKYLKAYRVIFTRNIKAKYFNTVYIDGMAGSGNWVVSIDHTSPSDQISLFEPEEEKDAVNYLRGSSRIALELESPFDYYTFIDLDEEKATVLSNLISSKYSQMERRTRVIHGECNDEVRNICSRIDWKKWRGVCFLDPYGMEIEWETIEVIAETKALDLWLLFPLGMSVCRLLRKEELPKGKYADRLTKLFGCSDWRNRFYATSTQMTLFGPEEKTVREADFSEIGSYFIERLKSVFWNAIDTPLILRNSKGSPIYLLCFAVGNEKGKAGLKIARDIIGKS